jgi:hypothetical protein
MLHLQEQPLPDDDTHNVRVAVEVLGPATHAHNARPEGRRPAVRLRQRFQQAGTGRRHELPRRRGWAGTHGHAHHELQHGRRRYREKPVGRPHRALGLLRVKG